MDDKTLTISSKSLFWIILTTILIALLIILLNSYDSKRKFNQFKQLNNLITNSGYSDRFANITQDFSPDDTVKIKLIKENLGLLNRDFEKINFSEIIIHVDSLYYTITSTQNYRRVNLISKDKYLEKKTENYISYIDNNEQTDLNDIYELSNDKSGIEIMIKIRDGCYLQIKQFRR